MMKFQSIELTPNYRNGYNRGATPGIDCSVTLQCGDKNYETVTVALTDDEAAEVVALAARKAVARFSDLDAGSINVVGTPGEPEPSADIAQTVNTLATEEAF